MSTSLGSGALADRYPWLAGLCPQTSFARRLPRSGLLVPSQMHLEYFIREHCGDPRGASVVGDRETVRKAAVVKSERVVLLAVPIEFALARDGQQATLQGD